MNNYGTNNTINFPVQMSTDYSCVSIYNSFTYSLEFCVEQINYCLCHQLLLANKYLFERSLTNYYNDILIFK